MSLTPPEPAPSAVPAQPPQWIIDLAVEASGWSPCRSKRGVVIFSQGNVISHGHNFKPKGFECDGSEACKATCRREAIHAEQDALMAAGNRAHASEMLHVKTVDGRLVPSGGPSCVECSKLARAAGIAWFWLYHVDGWRRYEMKEFHALSLNAVWLPAAALPVSPQESERGRMLNDYADLLELLGRELHAGTEQKYHRGFSIEQIRAAAVPPPQAWYPCKCGAEHSTPECPFAAVPPPPREEPTVEQIKNQLFTPEVVRTFLLGTYLELKRRSENEDFKRGVQAYHDAAVQRFPSVLHRRELAAAALPETPAKDLSYERGLELTITDAEDAAAALGYPLATVYLADVIKDLGAKIAALQSALPETPKPDDAADSHPGIGEDGPPINALCSRCACVVGQNALVHDVTVTDGRVMILRCNNYRQPDAALLVERGRDQHALCHDLREAFRAGFIAHPDAEAPVFAWNFNPDPCMASDREASAWEAWCSTDIARLGRESK